MVYIIGNLLFDADLLQFLMERETMFAVAAGDGLLQLCVKSDDMIGILAVSSLALRIFAICVPLISPIIISSKIRLFSGKFNVRASSAL